MKFQNQEKQLVQNDSLNLLLLKSQWGANGIAHLVPNKIKILSSKLKQQISSIYSYSSFPGGNVWSINYTLRLECLNKPEDFGILLQISNYIQKTNRQNFTYENYKTIYGMDQMVNGLIIYHTLNQISVGLFHDQLISRKDLLYQTKPCKIFRNVNNEVKFKIRQSNNGGLSIYIIDNQNQLEHLCAQYSNAVFDQFFISISGLDNQGQCSSEINNMILYGTRSYYTIDSSQKQVGDENFAFFTSSKEEERSQNQEKFDNMQKNLREEIKIAANELLVFADKNQKEIQEDFQSELNQQNKKIDLALEIIEKEALALQALGDFVSKNKENMNKDLDELFDQIINWLAQIEGTFTEVDNQTKMMYESINNVGLNEKMEELIEKTSITSAKLNSMLKKSKLVSKKNPMQGIDQEDFDTWINKLNELGNKDNSSQKFQIKNSFRLFLLVILWIVGGCILLGFLFMYIRIKSTIHKKRSI